jgi:hypothetical protein
LDGLFCNLNVYGLRFYLWGLLCWRAASFEKFRVCLLTAFRPPVYVTELRQRAFDGGVVEAEGDEAALLVERVAEAEGAGL